MAPKEDVDSDLHDYSTFCGKFRLVLQRIQSLWMKILLLAVNAGVVALVLWSVFSAPKSEISLTKSNTEFELLPSPSLLATSIAFPHESFDEATGSYVFNGSIFRGISSSIIQDNKSLVKSFEIVDSIIANASSLGTSLTGMTNLESIVIDVYDINGTFPRVHLPSLQSFNFTLRKRGAKAEDFKSPETLKQILFFDKQQSSWDLFELFNTGVSVSIWISGTVLIETSGQHSLVNIDTPNCQELLTKGFETLEIQGTTKLIMSWCPVSNVTLVPRSVEYLSLNNAVPTPVDRLSSLLTRLDNLQELHIYLPFLNYDEGSPSFYVTPKEPERQNQVDLAKVSPKLRTLSVVRAGLKWDSTTTTNGTCIQELAVQEANITCEVISNFARVFPQLNAFRLFNASGMPDNVDTKALLNSVLALSSVNSVVVTEYRREPSSRDQDTNGLPTGIEHFSMERTPGTSYWTTTLLNETQVDQLRFDHLKFTDVYKRQPAAAPSGAAGFGLIATCWLQVVFVIGVTVVWNCGFDKISREKELRTSQFEQDSVLDSVTVGIEETKG